MALADDEWREVADLLRRARSEGLSMHGDQRLRFLLAKQSPRAQAMGPDELVQLGLFHVGLFALIRGASGAGRPL